MMKEIKKVGKEMEERDRMIHDVDEFEQGQKKDVKYNEMLRKTVRIATKYCGGAKTVLEVGAGTGLLTEHLVNAYPDSTLIITEPDLRFLKRAREKLNDNRNVKLIQARAEYYEGERVDLIIGAEVYHHIPDDLKKRFFKNLHKHLKTGGSLILGDNFLPYYRREGDRIKALHIFFKPYIKAKDMKGEPSKIFSEAMHCCEEGRVEYKTCRAVMEKSAIAAGFKIVEYIELTKGIDDSGGYAIYVLSI